MSDVRIAATVRGLVHRRRGFLSRRLSWHES
jgi:hypothetical protein